MKKLFLIIALGTLLGCAKETPEPYISCEVTHEKINKLADEYNVFIYQYNHGEISDQEYSKFLAYYNEQNDLYYEQLKNCE